MKVKEESKKARLKLYIQKTKFVASGPITSWQIEGGKVEAVRNFIFLDSKITVDGGCSHEIKRCLILRREAMTNLDSVLKSRDITLLTKICRVKAMFFPIVMYCCESWTIKKAVCMLNHFSHVWLFMTRWTVAHQAPLSMGFSGQDYWSGLSCPPPKDLPNWGIRPLSHVSCIDWRVLYH